MAEVIIPVQLWADCVASAAPPELPLNQAAFVALVYIVDHPGDFEPAYVQLAGTTTKQANTIVNLKLQQIGIYADSINCYADWKDPLVAALVTSGLKRVLNLNGTEN